MTRSLEAPRVRAHIPALDGLRGLAILMVLAHDYNLLEEPESIAGRLIGRLFDAGWLGVQLFFVLSGFLITGILLDTRRAENYWPTFLGRRALRIFPLYYAVLFAAFVLAPLVGYAPAGSQHQIWLWTYLSNWSDPLGRSVPIFPHFWSLSIEEQFYLVWPLLVRSARARTLGLVSIGLVGLALLSRVLCRASGLGPDAAYMFTICRVDALALGAIAALALRDPTCRAMLAKRRALLRWSCAAIIVVTTLATRGAPRAGVLTQSFGYTLFALAFALLVLHAALASVDVPSTLRLESSAALRAAGRYSYGMYVFHTPLHVLVGMPMIARLTGVEAHGAHGVPFALGYLAVAVSVTFVAAAASYHLFEKHFLALKERMVPHADGA